MNLRYLLFTALVVFGSFGVAKSQPLFDIDSIAVSPGASFCLDLKVSDFTDITVYNFSLEWDAEIIQFDSITYFGLPDLNADSINFDHISEGTLGISSNCCLPPEPDDQGITLPNNSVILQLCFTQLGQCESTEINLGNFPVPIDIWRVNTGGNNIGAVMAENGPVDAICPHLILESEINNTDEDECLDVRLSNFIDIRGISFSITFDTLDLDFNEIIISDLDPPLILGLSSFDATFVSEGYLGMSWVPGFIDPVTFPDSLILFKICFDSIPESPYCSDPAHFSNFPISIEISDQNDQLLPYNLTPDTTEQTFFLTLSDTIPESCPGNADGSIMVEASGGIPPYTWSWSTGADTPNTINGLMADSYDVTVTDSGVCSAVLTDIPINNGLITYITPDTTICGGDDLQLLVEAPYATSYEWISNEPLSCTDCPNPVIQQPIGPEVYLVIVTGPDGCQQEKSVFVQVNQYLDFGLLEFSSSPVCEGDTLFFIPNVYNAQSYNWSGPGSFTSNEANPFITPVDLINAGEYILDIVDAAGCITGASFEVQVFPGPVFNADILQVSCYGECDGAISLNIIDEGTPPLEISWDIGSSSEILTDICAGPHSVTLSDQNCSLDATYYVNEPAPLIIDISEDTVICEGEIVPLYVDAPEALTYNWSPATFLDDPTIANPMAAPTLTVTFIATVTDIDGCMDNDQVTITVDNSTCLIPTTDTIGIGETISWCNPTDTFTLNIITAGILCGPSGFAELEIDASAGCYSLLGVEEGIDTLCIQYCWTGIPDTTICWVNQLALTVIDQSVWPGDTDSDGIANHFDLLPIGLAIDSTGPARPGATLDWIAQEAPFWPQYTPQSQINYRHIDTDGNGDIDLDDTLAIHLNWGLEHEFFIPPANYAIRNNPPPFYIRPDTLIEGADMQLPIILGDSDNPGEDIYGLAFSLYYDPDLVVPGTAIVDLSNSWLGTLNTDLIEIQRDFHNNGRIDIGITRINGQNISGFGQIGVINITIEDDILFASPNPDRNDLPAHFEIRAVRVINFQEEEIPVITEPTESEIISGLSQTELSRQVQVFPNPASRMINIRTKRLNLESVELLDVNGKVVRMLEVTNFKQQSGMQVNIPVTSMPDGVYLIRIRTDQGIVNRRIVIDNK